MTMRWNLLYDFVLLNLARRSPLPGGTTSRIFTVHAFLNMRWPEPYETTTLGYEASWAGVFPDAGKKIRQ
jgi:hypothetical protein